ncbi:MAG: PBP1A family penicillin-binding protein [Litoreibacter sp.]|nr:PBP1A family penicillin-binding protein [Litoreibacter sp.]
MAKSGKKKPLVAERRYPKKTAKKRKPAARSRKSGPTKRRGLLRRIIMAPFRFLFRLMTRLALRIAMVGILVIAAAIGYTYLTLPPLEALIDGRTRGSVTMLDRQGAVFAWRGDQFGGPISAAAVSPNLKNAVIATEDKRFYRHFGISPRGVASAIRINLREGRGALQGNGGSTITQQTAKLLCLGVPYDTDKWKSEAAYEADCRRTTMSRKIKEAIYALAMELKYSKDEILTVYLNRAYLGAGSRGFEAASQRYFSKSSRQLNVAEGAMLAGLLKAPSAYAPTNNLKRSQNRASVVVNLMQEQSYISSAEAAAAKSSPATLSAAATAQAGGYFADWIMDSAPSFLTRDTTEDVVIKTTFDARLQKAAEDALSAVFENKVRKGSKAQAAIVVMSSDGAVRAVVGGRTEKVVGAFNRATQAKRQTGSAFKPFVYAAAMDFGFQYDSIVEDAPFTIDIPGSGPWSPQNYTRDFKGPMTLTDALRQSINTVAVKVSEEVGRENVRGVAEAFGIDNKLANGPALALGASESTLLEMTGAYAGILNGGRSVVPYGLTELRLKGENAPILAQAGGMGDRVITPQAAQQLTYMMHRVITDGTGRRAQMNGREAAGKSGTTQAARDAWFIGFTAQYVVGVWMGYDDNTPLTGVTGGGLPAEIWRETMVRVSEGLPSEPLPMLRPAFPPSADGFVPFDRRRPRSDVSAEDIILDVLSRIFGR